MISVKDIDAAFNNKDVSIDEYSALVDRWFSDRGIKQRQSSEHFMRYIETLEAAIDEARRWCTPFLQEVEPTRIGGAFFKGTVTPTAKAVLALNIHRILNKAQHKREAAQ